MSKQSNSTVSLKPEWASDAETTILVSNPIGLTELSASLEALTLGPDSPATIVQCTQTISPMRGRESTGSPEKRDLRKASPSPGPKPRRYALEMWLEVEVGPGLSTSQEVAKQRCYYDRKAGAVTLQPGDVVMVRTDGFVGKQKVKDRWEDGGFIVES